MPQIFAGLQLGLNLSSVSVRPRDRLADLNASVGQGVTPHVYANKVSILTAPSYGHHSISGVSEPSLTGLGYTHPASPWGEFHRNSELFV